MNMIRPTAPGLNGWSLASAVVALAAALCSARTGLGAQTPESMLDLTGAVVVAPEGLSGPERKALTLLIEEVARRTLVTWKIQQSWPQSDRAVIAVGPARALRSFGGRLADPLGSEKADQAEGYRIRSDSRGPAVWVVGNDARGVLFGVGRLLRELRMDRDRVWLPKDFRVTSSPHFGLRGHQLGYRPKTNSYDAWDLPQWEQYIRDLAVFGASAVELIPPRSDDDDDSPHFPRPPLEMMAGMSKLLDDYGVDVWIWYPAMDADYSDPKTVEFALEEWGEVFARLPRIDAVFVPGGDPGHTRPKHLFALLEKQTESLRRYHPKATMWMSPQSFNQEWLDEFYELVRQEPKWLSGIVFGPQIRVSLAELRQAIPKRYTIRHYPDITHSRECQYPVPDWDLAFALTEAREVINPRPLGEATIFRTDQEYVSGVITYSEGCNDDVNKAIWSALSWDPRADVGETLRQYSRYFLADRWADQFAQGLLALERNWRGPLLTNSSVETTLQQFQDLERSARPQELLNWRFQQALYRAYYDAYTRDRLMYETRLESQALAELRQAKKLGAIRAIERARAVLERALTNPVSADRRARVFELAEALFQSIRMQLSVPRYKAISVGRGANLDTLDLPLNSRLWLEKQFEQIAGLALEADRLKAIEEIITRTDPGPGGYYDNLGDVSRQPHLVRGPGFEQDPAFLRSSLVGFGRLQIDWPMFWSRNAQSLNDAPLEMHYVGLDPTARYAVKVIYTGDNFRPKVRLQADGMDVHPWMAKPNPVRPVTFDVPAEATADGELRLSFTREPGLGGNGRGCQVSEVWLQRKAP